LVEEEVGEEDEEANPGLASCLVEEKVAGEQE
jgi:hypothetical protein